MKWVVKVDGHKKRTFKDCEEAHRMARLWWHRADRFAHVEIYSLGGYYGPALVEEYLPEL